MLHSQKMCIKSCAPNEVLPLDRMKSQESKWTHTSPSDEVTPHFVHTFCAPNVTLQITLLSFPPNTQPAKNDKN